MNSIKVLSLSAVVLAMVGCGFTNDSLCGSFDGRWDSSCTPSDDYTGEYGGGSYADWNATGGSGGGTASSETSCTKPSDCGMGRGCDTTGLCRDIVANCPLTDECLADPTGFAPESGWAGIDPTFVGTLGLGNKLGRIDLLMDFYSDHFYGEALLEKPFGYGDLIQATVTGTRNGSVLWGQIVPTQGGRDFDATFDAVLRSGSEIDGSITFRSAEFNGVVDLRLSRTSPCGCTPQECTTNADCVTGKSCVLGACVAPHPCQTSLDCETGTFCTAGVCQRGECSTSADCAGGKVCLSGVCETTCKASCECPSGMTCTEAGLCRQNTDAGAPPISGCDAGLGL